MNIQEKFIFLNLENRWPNFNLRGLEINPKGSLSLGRVPIVSESKAVTISEDENLNIPSGIAADREDNIFLSDPRRHGIFRYDPCKGTIQALSCIEGNGKGQPLLKYPRGLLIRNDDAVLVADSGNNRIVILDRRTFQIRAVWGQPGLLQEQKHADQNGILNDPWDLAGDKAGNVYIVDYGNRRIQKFDRWGSAVPSFWRTVESGVALQEPSFLAVSEIDNAEMVFLVDRKPDEVADQLIVLRLDGSIENCWPIAYHDYAPDPKSKIKSSGIMVTGNAVYIGDNGCNAILKFRTNGEYVGSAWGYKGTVSALGLDMNGNLLVHPGDPQKMVRLVKDKAFVPRGSFLAGPFNAEENPVKWHRMQIIGEPIPEEAQLKIFAYTNDDDAVAPPYKPELENPFKEQSWLPIPPDVLDALIPSPAKNRIDPLSRQFAEANSPLPRVKSKYLWIGGLLTGNENVSPIIHQIRITYNQDTYLRHLPSVYAKDDKSREFLERFLSLFESLLAGMDEEIIGLAPLFDPYAAPVSFLPWLASWLALEWDEDWNEQQQRDAIAQAFGLHGFRGTAEGMLRYLKLYTQIDAVIEEPLLWSSLWYLPVKSKKKIAKGDYSNCWAVCKPAVDPNDERQAAEAALASAVRWLQTEGSILGFTTMLAPAHAQGAVVGTTSTLDLSHLIEERDFGAPLFEDLAHFFYVLVPWDRCRCPGKLEKIKNVIEREKPAHTHYHLCVTEPKMRAGLQCRVGIDTIVADEPPDMVLTDQTRLGYDTIIADSGGIRRAEGRIGQDASIGIKTTIR